VGGKGADQIWDWEFPRWTRFGRRRAMVSLEMTNLNDFASFAAEIGKRKKVKSAQEQQPSWHWAGEPVLFKNGYQLV
jgi:hypothetical protein